MSKVITEETSIVSCDDIELNYKRPQKLLFKYSYPETVKLKGYVFLLHGYGAEPSYMDHLREYIAKEFSVVAVDVYYHCFFSRLENGASLEFDDIDLAVLQDFIKQYEIDFSTLQNISTESVLYTINQKLNTLKINKSIKSDFVLQLPITIIPKNNEYQNFGFMQAVDYINVIHELEKIPFNFEEGYTTTLMGSSHGGYLAHLIAKLAPHKINCVIDNSCYVKPPSNYFLGKELNILNPEYIFTHEHIQLNCFVQTLWTTNQKSKYLFTTDHFRIRDLNDHTQLEIMSTLLSSTTKYISYHSTQDGIANINDKDELYKKLKILGFDATLNIINQIDGKFIKTLAHGMNMSLKELANRELPTALAIKNIKNIKNQDIIYEGDSKIYKLIYRNNILTVKIVKIK